MPVLSWACWVKGGSNQCQAVSHTEEAMGEGFLEEVRLQLDSEG